VPFEPPPEQRHDSLPSWRPSNKPRGFFRIPVLPPFRARIGKELALQDPERVYELFEALALVAVNGRQAKVPSTILEPGSLGAWVDLRDQVSMTSRGKYGETIQVRVQGAALPI